MPIYRLAAVGYQILVGLRKVLAAQKRVPSQRAWMRRHQYLVLAAVYQGCFALCELAPEHKRHVLALRRDGADGGIGELLPAYILVGVGFLMLYGQRGVD